MKTIKNLTADQLRKSILQLAIQGKLVKQDPNDEPASELVKRIYAEKQKLIKEGKIKKDKNESYIFKGDDNCYYEKIGNNTPVKLEDLPFDIPDNWTWIRLKDLISIQTGASFKKEQSTKESKDNYIRVLRGGNILPFKYLLKQDDLYIPSELVSENILLKENDLITPAVTSLENIGKIAVIDKNLDSVTAGGFVYIFRPYINNTTLSILMSNFISSSLYQSLMKKITKKSGQAFYNMNKEKLLQLYYPLAPLTEQVRIIDKLGFIEPLLEKYDSIEKELSALEAEFPEKLKKSILQYAIEGKLVKQDPNDEPASVLLERIKAEKERLIKEGKIKRDKSESYIYQGDDKNYYENLPESYVVTYLSSAGNWRSGATPQRGNNEYYGGDIAWIKTGELNNATIYDSVEKVTRAALSKCSLPINDIGNVLIAMYGATIGKIAIAGIPLTTNQACCGCKPFSGINNKYLFYYLMANKQRFIDSAEGGAQPNISREKIIAYPFVLPPYNEQIRISKKLEFILGQIPC